MELVRLGFGVVNAYLLKGSEGDILVDTGMPGMSGPLLRLLRRHGSGPERLRLIIITHAHFDHVGGLAALRARSGAPVLVHRADEPWLRTGYISFPGGLTPVARVLMGLGAATAGRFRLAGCAADVVVDDRFDLGPFGVEGELVHTPGHTAGSLSLLLPSGDALVGDLCQNGALFAMGMRPVVPPLADLPEALLPSFRRVLAGGARRLYPGHGDPFGQEMLKEAIGRLEGRP